MPRRAATRKGDIGVENAAPEDIVRALGKVAYTRDEGRDEFTAQDLDRAGLTGGLAPVSGGRRWEKRWASAMPTAAAF